MPEIVFLHQPHHARSFLEYFGDRAVAVDDVRPSVVMQQAPELVVTFDESQPDRAVCIGELARQGVATLLIMDGIPEWRNTWSRAAASGMHPLNQPVLSHKVACLGHADARLFESWGNGGKCEVVGIPRFDRINRPDRPIRLEPVTGRPMRLLIMTAKTPGFNPQEVETTYRSLVDLRDALQDRTDIQIVWRITQGLHRKLGVSNTFTEATGAELWDVLGQMDAVITTPSTAMLEGMLFGLPVALLDYHNCPHYIPAAWQITCQGQIEPVLNDLRNAPRAHMLYQEFCLQDALECRTPALPRAIQLMEAMLRISREQRAAGQAALQFPQRIIADVEPLYLPGEHFDLEALYPTHPVFARRDLDTLRMELDAALVTIEQLKSQVDVLTNRLHSIPGYTFFTQLGKRLQKKFV